MIVRRGLPFPTITITESPSGLAVVWGQHPSISTIPLNATHAERTLTNLFMHLRCRVKPSRIHEHLTYHQSDADPQCPCCKLEGRVLSALGRKANSQVSRGPASSSKVQIRHLPAGLSGAQIAELDRKRGLWANKSPTAQQPLKSTKQRIEDLI